MGKAKGFRILKRAAEDFVNFKPAAVTTKVKAHPKLLALADQMSQPLPPLRYKLHELPSPDTSLNVPLGNTELIPFYVTRTFTGNLPVYTEYRNNHNRKLTVIRRLTGDVDEFKNELSKVVSNAPLYQRMGRIEVKGLHSQVVKLWLRRLGF